jgi:hypothetical protein
MKSEKEKKTKIDQSPRLQVEDLKIWDSTWIYDSGRISGATDKGIAIKACYLSTPRARELGPRIDVVEIWDDVIYRHYNLYWTRPDPRDLATYI